MFDWITGKKVRVSFSLSPASLETLDAIADHTHLTRSEVIEALSEGRLSLLGEKAKTQFTLSAKGVRVNTHPDETDPPSPVSTVALETVAASRTDSAADPVREAASQSQGRDATFLKVDETAELIQEAAFQPPHIENTKASPEPLHQQIATLNQQLADLQACLAQQRDREIAQKAQNADLAQQTQEQQQRLEVLEQQITQLQQMATIGEAQINRWRFQTYSR